jgi:Fe2+ transport system protein FeoA
MSTLADVPIGGSARVVGVSGDAALEQRILEMGLIPGAVVKVIREAVLRDPIEIKLMGYNLSLRRSEAKCVEIELL